jgi:hypothetical protein
MEQNEKTTEESKDRRVLSFRAPKIVQKQIAELMAAWGENTTHVVHRALAIAHSKEFGKKRS